MTSIARAAASYVDSMPVLDVLLAWRGSSFDMVASAWYVCRVPGCVGWPGAALSSAGASAGSLHLFCFLVSARRPQTHVPTRFAPGMRERR